MFFFAKNILYFETFEIVHNLYSLLVQPGANAPISAHALAKMIEQNQFRIMFSEPDQLIERRLRSPMENTDEEHFRHAFNVYPPLYKSGMSDAQVFNALEHESVMY
jgi:hypothetical protein